MVFNAVVRLAAGIIPRQGDIRHNVRNSYRTSPANYQFLPMNNTPDNPGFYDANSVRYWLFVATIYAVGIVAGLLAVQ